MHFNKALIVYSILGTFAAQSFAQASLPTDCGEVVATHFSGLDASDNPDPDGAVLTLLDARIPPTGSTPWPTAGQLWSPPLFNNIGAGPDEWTARNLGTIFGLAFSTGTDPDIFVAASPGMYGNYDPGAIGVVGPAGEGGIYKIDGVTGQISIFMYTGSNGITEMPNLGPGLGNIHIQKNGPNQTDQIYTTNLDDGKIYLIDASGLIVQAYDPFGANQTADGIYANLGERPFAVAVNPQGTLLYFSVWLRDSGRTATSWPASAGSAPTNPNNSIWSVEVNPGGLLSGTPQLEIVLPYFSNTYSNPVTDISFTSSGSMLVAERTFLSDYGTFDVGHSARILEFENNAPSSRSWNLGLAINNNIAANAVGGVSSDDDSHTWATCDQALGGVYGITRLPYPGNTIATRLTSSIPIDIPGPQKNGMGEIDCMICSTPEPVGACCVTDTNGTDYCVEVTSDECMYTYAGTFYGVGSTCMDATTCPTVTVAACCYGDADCNWYCDMLTNDDCAAIDGLFYNTFTCDTISCVDPNYGACCYENPAGIMACVYTNLEKCDFHYFGIWHPEIPCDCVCDETNGLGACCYEDPDLGWQCTWTDLFKCDNVYFGTWYANTPCSQIDCPPISDQGACCYDDPDLGWQCIDNVSATDCESIYNGTWYANTPCSQIDCPPIIYDEGACCYEDIDLGWQCVWTDQGQCENGFLGTWYAGIPCIDIDCPPFTEEGACCYEIDCVWDCNMLLEDDCGSLAGIFYSNTQCDHILCPDPNYGACCYEDPDVGFICVFTDADDCWVNLLGTWHQGESCECEPCDTTGGCNADVGSLCVGPPQYPYPGYTIFGSGPMGVQTASPSINGGSVLMLFDLNGPPIPLPVGTNLDPYIYNHPSWAGSGNDLGSIFGLAMDEAGNIYVSTSKTWNGSDPVGIGGWGAIYKVDTNDASISIWATLPMPNSESGLGSITYDCEHSQFFATSFEDGLIYRLDMSGNILDSFDHGVPYTGNPGPVAFGNRPWAVEVNGDRLYYSMWNGNLNDFSSMPNEIWSIALTGPGMPIAGTEQLEIALPPFNSNSWSSPIADIDFSPTKGTMVLGERVQSTITSLSAHQARVFEYECTNIGWTQTSHVFGIGTNGTDAAGGVDATEEYVWASGDALEFGPDYIYGFQGMPVTGGNPIDSVLVDYQGDVTAWQTDKKMLGDLVISESKDDEGACCYEDDSLNSICVWTDQDQCDNVYLGTWYDGIDCIDIECPPLNQGACCYTIDCEWYCDMLTFDACEALLGIYYAQSTCTDPSFTCNDEYYGACCYENAAGIMTCVWTNIEKCEFYYFGVWHPDESCECIDCDEYTTTGACCYMDESGIMLCAIMDVTSCSELPESTFYGAGSQCNNVVCCLPVGACCIEGDCLLASVTQCNAAGGAHYGNGVPCSNVSCETHCVGDINHDGLVDIEDLLMFISAWGICP